MTSYIFRLLFVLIASLLHSCTIISADSSTNSERSDVVTELYAEDITKRITPIEDQTKLYSPIDEGTRKIDELGKQILDAPVDVEDDKYFCPCTKSQYDRLSMNKLPLESVETPKPVSKNTKANATKSQQIQRRSSKTYRNNVTYSHVEESKTSYTEEQFVESTNQEFDNSKTSCATIHNLNHIESPTGAETIILPDLPPFKVRCEPDVNMECSWTVVLERKSKDDNFDLKWQQYREGFGDPELGEAFFVGLENLYALTQYEEQELYFFTRFEQENLAREKYEYFNIGPESTGYKVLDLHVLSNVTMVRRLLKYSSFSTKDKHVGKGYSKCAARMGMGWWYSASCKQSSILNSVRAYVKSPTIMAVRPRDCMIAGALH